MKYQDIFPKKLLKKTDEYSACGYTMNAYEGCEYGCRFCFGRSERHWPDGGNVSFSDVILVKKNAPELLRKELETIRKISPISFGEGVNDSYQPCEKDFQITRGCLEVIREKGFPLHIMTRSALIRRDMQIIKDIAGKGWCHVTFSIPSPDDELRKLLEPDCEPVNERWKALAEFSSAGIPSGVSFTPIMPHINDDESQIDKMFRLAKENGASYILDVPLILSDYQKEYFLAFMAKTPKLRKFLNRYQRLYKNGYTPTTSYIRKVNRMIFDLSTKYGLPRSMPEFSGKK